MTRWAHARDELGITEVLSARPMQAALASAASFAVGAALPLAVTAFGPETMLIPLFRTPVAFPCSLGGCGGEGWRGWCLGGNGAGDLLGGAGDGADGGRGGGVRDRCVRGYDESQTLIMRTHFFSFLLGLLIAAGAYGQGALPPLPAPMGVPKPGPVGAGPYAPQPILPGAWWCRCTRRDRRS